MNKYSNDVQMALSDLIFSWGGEMDTLQNILEYLGYHLTVDEMLEDLNSRL